MSSHALGLKNYTSFEMRRSKVTHLPAAGRIVMNDGYAIVLDGWTVGYVCRAGERSWTAYSVGREPAVTKTSISRYGAALHLLTTLLADTVPAGTLHALDATPTTNEGVQK